MLKEKDVTCLCKATNGHFTRMLGHNLHFKLEFSNGKSDNKFKPFHCVTSFKNKNIFKTFFKMCRSRSGVSLQLFILELACIVQVLESETQV